MVISAGAHEAPIGVTPLTPDREPAWSEFLARAANATLFHRLDFLAYHPKERFRFHHLMLHQDGKLVALLPGGLAGAPDRTVLTSPLGASIGGLVLLPGTRTGQVVAMVEALQAYVAQQGWSGIELTIPPAVYAPGLGEILPYALVGRGFALMHRWLCPMVPIRSGEVQQYLTTFRSRAGEVRAAHRAGVTADLCGVDGLADFLQVFDETYARHGVAATHSAAEVEDLLTRLPQDVRLFLAMQDGVAVAGVLIMLLSEHVAYSFYICSRTNHPEKRGNLVAFAALLDWLGERNYAWLDLGPGSWDQNFNHGIMFFKERLGAIGYNRDRWIWRVPR